MKYTKLFEPLLFKRSGLAVKNRLFRSNITGRFDNYDGSGTEARVEWERFIALIELVSGSPLN